MPAKSNGHGDSPAGGSPDLPHSDAPDFHAIDSVDDCDESTCSGVQNPASVAMDPPCPHNNWDNVRVKKRVVTLSCRDCRCSWKQTHPIPNLCPDFYQRVCPFGPHCPYLHVHRFKSRAKSPNPPGYIEGTTRDPLFYQCAKDVLERCPPNTTPTAVLPLVEAAVVAASNGTRSLIREEKGCGLSMGDGAVHLLASGSDDMSPCESPNLSAAGPAPGTAAANDDISQPAVARVPSFLLSRSHSGAGESGEERLRTAQCDKPCQPTPPVSPPAAAPQQAPSEASGTWVLPVAAAAAAAEGTRLSSPLSSPGPSQPSGAAAVAVTMHPHTPPLSPAVAHVHSPYGMPLIAPSRAGQVGFPGSPTSSGADAPVQSAPIAIAPPSHLYPHHSSSSNTPSASSSLGPQTVVGESPMRFGGGGGPSRRLSSKQPHTAHFGTCQLPSYAQISPALSSQGGSSGSQHTSPMGLPTPASPSNAPSRQSSHATPTPMSSTPHGGALAMPSSAPSPAHLPHHQLYHHHGHHALHYQQPPSFPHQAAVAHHHVATASSNYSPPLRNDLYPENGSIVSVSASSASNTPSVAPPGGYGTGAAAPTPAPPHATAHLPPMTPHSQHHATFHQHHGVPVMYAAAATQPQLQPLASPPSTLPPSAPTSFAHSAGGAILSAGGGGVPEGSFASYMHTSFAGGQNSFFGRATRSNSQQLGPNFSFSLNQSFASVATTNASFNTIGMVSPLPTAISPGGTGPAAAAAAQPSSGLKKYVPVQRTMAEDGGVVGGDE